MLCGAVPGPTTHFLASRGETIVSAEHPCPRFLTIKDVAAELTTSESQIRAMISCGDLPAIEGSKLEEYIQRMYEQAARNLDTIPVPDDDDG